MHRYAYAAALLPVLAGKAAAAQFAYVPNEKPGTISVIDTDGDTVVRTITPDGRTVYVSTRKRGACAARSPSASGRGTWRSHRMAPGCTWPTAARVRRP